MKPIIGVSPLWDDKKESIWMLPGYMDAIRISGGVPFIFPLEAEGDDLARLFELCDGFLLTGGHDVSPVLYNQAPSEQCGQANALRDKLEAQAFSYALEADKPVLGICRGIQIINALCGGTLYQDLPTEHEHELGIDHVNHQMEPPYDKVCHRVSIVEGSPLFEALGLAESGITEIGVNSYHHQAIKDLAPTLESMAISEDGLIEAVYMPSQNFIQAVQWHPEFSFHSDENSRRIVASFIEACALDD